MFLARMRLRALANDECDADKRSASRYFGVSCRAVSSGNASDILGWRVALFDQDITASDIFGSRVALFDQDSDLFSLSLLPGRQRCSGAS